MENINRNQNSPESLDEEDSFSEKVLLGSQMPALACKADRDGSPTASSSSVNSLSPVDTHAPSELSAICLLEDTFRPTPPPQTVPLSRKRVSRLPVFTAKLSGTGQFL